MKNLMCFFKNRTDNYTSLNITEINNTNYISISGDTGRLWTIIIIITSVVLLKFVFRALINDKPKWVREEEEKQKVSLQKKLNQVC